MGRSSRALACRSRRRYTRERHTRSWLWMGESNSALSLIIFDRLLVEPCRSDDNLSRMLQKPWRTHSLATKKKLHTQYCTLTSTIFVTKTTYAAAMASISTSTSLGSFSAEMQVRAGLGVGSTTEDRSRSCVISSSMTHASRKLRSWKQSRPYF